jgi:hypothetical protein
LHSTLISGFGTAVVVSGIRNADSTSLLSGREAGSPTNGSDKSTTVMTTVGSPLRTGYFSANMIINCALAALIALSSAAQWIMLSCLQFDDPTGYGKQKFDARS